MSKNGEPFAHLAPAVRAWALAASDAERIERLLTDRWIGYTRALEALDRLEWLLRHPQRTRMPNLLLVGPTNNGKTMIAAKFLRDHPATTREDGDGDIVPVLHVQCPDAADPRRFHHEIAEALGAPSRPGDSLARKQAQAMHLLRATGVRLLIVDEVHNILAGGADRMNQMLNLLRYLGNALRIPIVAIGVRQALQVIHSDDQLATRFEPFPLPRWRDDDALRTLLASLEATLPLRRPSVLIDARLTRRVLGLSEGVLGEIVALLARAGEAAIRSGVERIDDAMLDATGFVPPAQRRMSAAALGVD